MKILRSILALVAGAIVSMVIMVSVEMANFATHAPDRDKPFMEQMEQMQKDKKAMKAFVESLPIGAFVAVLFGWQGAAFVGGGVAALIAGRWRLVHAGIIGGLVLAGTVMNALNMKREFGISHPDWMLIAGLLLPIPLSLIAGKIVSLLFPSPAVNSP